MDSAQSPSSSSNVVWNGNVGSIPLKVEVPHAGRILAEWRSSDGTRQKSSKTVEEFEKTVLFKLIVSSGPEGMPAAQEALKAVAIAEAERPAPRTSAEPRKRKPKNNSRRRPRRRY